MTWLATTQLLKFPSRGMCRNSVKILLGSDYKGSRGIDEEVLQGYQIYHGFSIHDGDIRTDRRAN